MDEKQNRETQSGYDQDTFGQAGRESYHQDSYNYSQKYNGQQGLFEQTTGGQERYQTPPDGGAFYHSGEPPQGMGFGIASMVLGIVSVVLFCTCINIPFAVVAIIFGIVHICRHTGSNGFAIAGIVTSIISVILTVILTTAIYLMGINSASSWVYSEYFPFENYFYDNYDNYDYYDYDDYSDYENHFHGNDDCDGTDF